MYIPTDPNSTTIQPIPLYTIMVIIIIIAVIVTVGDDFNEHFIL